MRVLEIDAFSRTSHCGARFRAWTQCAQSFGHEHDLFVGACFLGKRRAHDHRQRGGGGVGGGRWGGGLCGFVLLGWVGWWAG